MDSIWAKGLRIAYRRVGAGPPLLLVHGAAADGRIWQPQLDGLSDDFTLVVWDEPGSGQSSDLPWGFGLTDYADCLAALIGALDLGPVHIAGHSWGGTVVLELCRRHPGLVATLIMIDAYAGWKGSLPDGEVRERVAGARQMFAAPPDQFEPTFPGLFAGDPPASVLPLLAAVSADVRPATLGHQLMVMAETDQSDLLPHIGVPTLLVWGREDARSPLEVARQFDAAIPDTELVLIDGAGHMSPLEQPQRVNQVVRTFCLDHASPARQPTYPPK